MHVVHFTETHGNEWNYEVNHNDCVTLRSNGYDLFVNQIDTLSTAFQAFTVACARCHNHKNDAFSTQDYHAMLVMYRS